MIDFEIGRVYNRRRDIHAVFGSQQQGGISTPASSSVIFLFTGDSGKQYGYKDGWGNDDIFRYTGEGQFGDMQFRGGNPKATAFEEHCTHCRKCRVLLKHEGLIVGMIRAAAPGLSPKRRKAKTN